MMIGEQDNNQPDYKKLIEALCAEKDVSLISVGSAKQLGEMAGVRSVRESEIGRIMRCDVTVVQD